MWERDYYQNARKSTEVLLTAKKRVHIVQASECSRLVIGGGTWELPTGESSKIGAPVRGVCKKFCTGFHFCPGSIPVPIQRWFAPE